MIKPKNILEIGTYTGYSGICLAEGLSENGKLITIDINDELHEMVCSYFDKAGIASKSEIICGDAREIIPGLNEKFDLIFIDADKESYSTYYDLAFEKLNIGGYIIADNVLWSGNVLKEEKNWDRDTKWIVAFNEKVNADERANKVLLPIRDGLYLIERIK
jgi:predicted O-methyltransferase YrrM